VSAKKILFLVGDFAEDYDAPAGGRRNTCGSTIA